MRQDIALTLTQNKYYDISIGSDGDLLGTNGLDTALLMSILCEKRAEVSEVTKPEFRRGDWSNELNSVDGYEVGSKAWLLDSARANQESIDFGIDYINDGLQWMIDDNIIKSVDTVGALTSRGIVFTVSVTNLDSSVEKRVYEMFENTRKVG